MNNNAIDKTVVTIAAICCLTFVFLTMASPEQVKDLFDKIFHFFISNFGWAYMTCVAGFVVFCLAVASEALRTAVFHWGLHPSGPAMRPWLWCWPTSSSARATPD